MLSHTQQLNLFNIFGWFSIIMKNICKHTPVYEWETSSDELDVMNAFMQIIDDKYTLKYKAHLEENIGTKLSEYEDDRANIFFFTNEKRKKLLKFGFENLNKAKPYMYIQPWDEEVMNGLLLVFQIPEINPESIKIFEECFERFIKIETKEEIPEFDFFLKKTNDQLKNNR